MRCGLNPPCAAGVNWNPLRALQDLLLLAKVSIPRLLICCGSAQYRFKTRLSTHALAFHFVRGSYRVALDPTRRLAVQYCRALSACSWHSRARYCRLILSAVTTVRAIKKGLVLITVEIDRVTGVVASTAHWYDFNGLSYTWNLLSMSIVV